MDAEELASAGKKDKMDRVTRKLLEMHRKSSSSEDKQKIQRAMKEVKKVKNGCDESLVWDVLEVHTKGENFASQDVANEVIDFTD